MTETAQIHTLQACLAALRDALVAGCHGSDQIDAIRALRALRTLDAAIAPLIHGLSTRCNSASLLEISELLDALFAHELEQWQVRRPRKLAARARHLTRIGNVLATWAALSCTVDEMKMTSNR